MNDYRGRAGIVILEDMIEEIRGEYDNESSSSLECLCINKKVVKRSFVDGMEKRVSGICDGDQ